MKKRLLLLVIAAAGCGAQQDWMPLELGRTSHYSVSTEFGKYITEVKVSRQVSIGSETGVALTGPMGESHIGWKDGVLLVERFPGARFSPPIPMLVDSRDRLRRNWKGTVQGIWGSFQGTATMDQGMVEEEIGGIKASALKSDLTIQNPSGKSIRVQTLFQPGIGIAAQKHWLGGDLMVWIERQSSS
ncbi:MAG TPA: hypothetical protein VJQ25_02245 [Nitrospira sp.]|nr:hypothetical protein [Nitrospira sp.]